MIDSSVNTTKTKKQILQKENEKKNGNYDSDFSDYTTKETAPKKKYDSASSRSSSEGIFFFSKNKAKQS